MSPSFSAKLLRWFDRHGRVDLPWQRDSTPYRVWVSEIMLQQTQVGTVIPYYRRFMARFPTLGDLARGEEDEVLHLWSGLGYYARARNLHRAARRVREEHGGVLPSEREGLEALPGIGRSTAGAILALSGGQRHPILDGNVKRVLCRYHGIAGWPGESGVLKELWRLADRHTPARRVAAYTQAIMDLGATVCARTKPACSACPLSAGCVARLEGTQSEYPAPRPARADRPRRETAFLIVLDGRRRVLLEKRPPGGIWGGLWGFPEAPSGVDPRRWCEERLGRRPRRTRRLPVVHHGFTHFDLDILPIVVAIDERAPQPAPGVALEGPRSVWYNTVSPRRLGLAAPVTKLLAAVSELDSRAEASVTKRTEGFPPPGGGEPD